MKKFIIYIVGVVIVGAVFVNSFLSDTSSSDIKKGSIVCFGDSITEGLKFLKAGNYPHQLGLLLGETVINEGISGETSSHALQRIKKDVLEISPRFVIIQFGGNDPYHKIPHTTTLENLDSMVEQVHNIGAVPVLLIGESNMLQPKYLDGFREIASRRKVLLIENAIAEIIKNPKLRVDGVHPNTKGHKILARKIFDEIKELLK